MHEGRWFYECHNFTGDWKEVSEVSIVWSDTHWRVVMNTSAQKHIDNNGYAGTSIDIQYTSTDTVCIDPDATYKAGL